jgi:hypothetical protein
MTSARCGSSRSRSHRGQLSQSTPDIDRHARRNDHKIIARAWVSSGTGSRNSPRGRRATAQRARVAQAEADQLILASLEAHRIRMTAKAHADNIRRCAYEDAWRIALAAAPDHVPH